MTTIKVNDKGVVTYGDNLPEGQVEFYFETIKNTASNVALSTDEDGMLVTRSIEQTINYTNYHYTGSLSSFEFLTHSGSAQIASGALNFVQLQINGLGDNYRGGLNNGLNTWNTSSNVFQPDALTASYLIRINGNIAPVGGNPIFNLDFVLSGDSPDIGDHLHHLRHHQSYEKTVRNTQHQHILATYTVFSDPDMYASGGVFYMSSDGSSLSVVSAAIHITKL